MVSTTGFHPVNGWFDSTRGYEDYPIVIKIHVMSEFNCKGGIGLPLLSDNFYLKLKLTQYKIMSNRKRIIKQTSEKVNLTRFYRTKINRRKPIDAETKRQLMLSFEVRDMFRELSGINLREKTEINVLSKVNTVDQITPVQKTVVVPTAYEVVQDAVLGTFRKGKQFVQTQVEKLEVLPVIDWSTLK